MNELIAIDPTAFSDSRDLKYLLERFGFHEGRFVAEYPKRWTRMVFEHLETLPPYDAKRAKVLFEKYRNNRLISPGCVYSSDKPWHDNAIGAKALKAVDDVIGSRGNTVGLPSPDDIDEEYFFKCGGRQCNVLSSARDYAQVAAPLLTVSHEVAIVDPFIVCFEKRFQNVLLEMASIAKAGGKCQAFKIFTIEDRSTLEQLARGAKQFFAPICNYGMSAELTVLRDTGQIKADDHPRFLISIKGAMQFDHGFDEESPPRERVVSTIDSQLHDRLCSQYFEGNLPFKVVSHLKF